VLLQRAMSARIVNFSAADMCDKYEAEQERQTNQDARDFVLSSFCNFAGPQDFFPVVVVSGTSFWGGKWGCGSTDPLRICDFKFSLTESCIND